MKFSAFAPLGLLAFAAGPSPAKRIYDDMVRGLGGAEGDLGVMPGTYLDGKCFSRAIRIALARKHLIRAKRQTFPATVDVHARTASRTRGGHWRRHRHRRDPR